MAGLTATLLALAAQFYAGLAVAREPAVLATMGVICHTGPSPSGAPAPLHHDRDCALCPLCAALSTSGAVLAARAAIPPPAAILRIRSARPFQARAPPPYRRVAARLPRGPPVPA